MADAREEAAGLADHPAERWLHEHGESAHATALIVVLVRFFEGGDGTLEGDLRGSATAYRAASEARWSVGSMGAVAAAKALAGSVRDVVAWRRIRLYGAESKEAFIHALDAAFDGGLSSDHNLRSQLLNSFHRIAGGDPSAFKSRSSQRRKRRPRNRRAPSRGSGVVTPPLRARR